MLGIELVFGQGEAYATGSSIGLIVRTVVLGLIAFALVKRILRGEWGAGLRNSQAGAFVGLAAATVLLVYSVGQILDRGSAVVTDPAYAQGMVDMRAGCVDAGSPAAYCECLTSEIDARVPAGSRKDFSARINSSGGDFAQIPELVAAIDVCRQRMATG